MRVLSILKTCVALCCVASAALIMVQLHALFTTDRIKDKIILHWTDYYVRHDSVFDPDWFRTYCKVKTCRATSDRGQIHKADAVIFNLFRTLWAQGDIPEFRSPSQHYVAFINEPATYTWIPERLSELPTDFFNVSLTYRRDSHVQFPYFTIVEREEKFNVSTIIERVASHPKEGLVAWFVSHCNTPSKRELYVKELQKYIPIDIYGLCGPLKCSSKQGDKIACYEMLERKYKFYLSFENSFCRDYATEKLGDILMFDIVPVTLGGADYATMAPPYSYINALDFESPLHLANYLKMLSADSAKYLKYFEWKANYAVFGKGFGLTYAHCELCALLHGKIPYESHKDLKSWWLPPGICKAGNFSF